METWADVRKHVLSVASALIAAGVKSHDSVLLISENRVEWVYCDFAIQTIGAVESDPSAGRISVESPVGRALVGRKKGDKITVSVPAGSLTLTIKAVK